MSWEYIRLSELYEVHNGLSKGGKFFGNGFPFLSFSTVFNNWFLPAVLPDLVQSTEKEQISYSIERGDVFITRTSETMDELGMSSVALKSYPQATYNGFTKRLRPIDNRILPEFVGYYLRCPVFRGGFILLLLGDKLEGQRAKLKQINKALEDSIFTLLNNLNLRHNNIDTDSKEYNSFVATMPKKEIESWYDEVYQLCLLAFLEIDNVERARKVKELKQKLDAGR